VHLPQERDGIDQFRALLLEMLPSISTAAETLQDRRAHRQIAARMRAASVRRRVPRRRVAEPKVLVAVAFSAQGLFKLTPGAAEIPSPAFSGRDGGPRFLARGSAGPRSRGQSRQLGGGQARR